jgi:isoamylase
VELLPVHAIADDRMLVEKRLRNYWGYNTMGFFAPDPRYLATGALGELKTTVKHLHSAGIEVILDVVYNHTAEGNELGPTLSFRGIDNASYYRLVPGAERYYDNTTGCGNSLDLRHPRTLQMVMDSLRYWSQEMHVDGFRFDLATTLARGDGGGFEWHSGFLQALHQDPVLSRLKLIAEPWDVGPDGYQLGNFPAGWSEWNDRYRNTVRRYWRGDDGMVPDLAFRVTGSSDLFEKGGRRPRSSVNFVTAHDGFTLEDLVSYDGKHNEANLEDNRDGSDENSSWNCGAEGPTDDAGILRLRMQQKRNMLATLLLAQGLPMLLAGDEFGQSQGGNNNAYAQDNETTWLDWRLLEKDASLFEFARELIRLRRLHPALRRTLFFHGVHFAPGAPLKDITWLMPDGGEMTEEAWSSAHTRAFALLLGGDPGDTFVSLLGYPEIDDSFALIFNAHFEPVDFVLPQMQGLPHWEVAVDTTWPDPLPAGTRFEPGGRFAAHARSFALLRGPRNDPANGNHS